MAVTEDKKPPAQIMQPPTLQIPVIIYPPSLTWKIAQFAFDNYIPHLIGLILAFNLSFVFPIFVQDAALVNLLNFISLLISFGLGATIGMYGKGRIEIWRHWFRLKKW